jgi:hypothetical protein
LHLPLAYLDPSTGSLGFQIAISGLLAAAATARIYWQRLKRLVSRRQPEAVEAESSKTSAA